MILHQPPRIPAGLQRKRSKGLGASVVRFAKTHYYNFPTGDQIFSNFSQGTLWESFHARGLRRKNTGMASAEGEPPGVAGVSLIIGVVKRRRI